MNTRALLPIGLGAISALLGALFLARPRAAGAEDKAASPAAAERAATIARAPELREPLADETALAAPEPQAARSSVPPDPALLRSRHERAIQDVAGLLAASASSPHNTDAALSAHLRVEQAPPRDWLTEVASDAARPLAERLAAAAFLERLVRQAGGKDAASAAALSAAREALGQPDATAAMRMRSAAILASLGGPDEHAALIEQLRGSDEDRRRTAAAALRAAQSPESLAALTCIAREPRDGAELELALNALAGMAEMREPGSLPAAEWDETVAAIAERLREPGASGVVRVRGAAALGAIGGRAACEELQRWVAADDPVLVPPAFRSLGQRLAREPAPELIDLAVATALDASRSVDTRLAAAAALAARARDAGASGPGAWRGELDAALVALSGTEVASGQRARIAAMLAVLRGEPPPSTSVF